MIILNIQVPESRSATALATLRDGNKTLLTGHAAASATVAIASANGNPSCDPLRIGGHPPVGHYQLLDKRPAKKEQAAEYGMNILLFEPRSGQASSAEAYGRLGLLVYGGPPGRDKLMRRTQGGLRLSNDMLSAVVKKLGNGLDMSLQIDYLQQASWWQFWKRNVTTPPLSTSVLTALTPPLDEKSILEMMMRGLPRRPTYGRSLDNTDTRRANDARDNSQNSDYSSSSSSSEDHVFRGGGGQSAGGGASGGWDSKPVSSPASPSNTPTGVDSAGRIATGVAAGVVAGAVIGAAAHALADSKTGNNSTDSGENNDRNTTSSTAY